MGAATYTGNDFKALTEIPHFPRSQPARAAGELGWISDLNFSPEQMNFWRAMHQRWFKREDGRWAPTKMALSDESLDFMLRHEVRGTFPAKEFADSPASFGGLAYELLDQLSDGVLQFRPLRSSPPASFFPKTLEDLKLEVQKRTQDKFLEINEDEASWPEQATLVFEWFFEEATMFHLWCCYHYIQSCLLETQKESWQEWLRGEEQGNPGKVVQRALEDVVRSLDLIKKFSVPRGSMTPSNP